jgi:hypothetical protein
MELHISAATRGLAAANWLCVTQVTVSRSLIWRIQQNSDSTVFQNCVFGNKISGSKFNIPEHRSLPEDSGDVLPSVFVGGEE